MQHWKYVISLCFYLKEDEIPSYTPNTVIYILAPFQYSFGCFHDTTDFLPTSQDYYSVKQYVSLPKNLSVIECLHVILIQPSFESNVMEELFRITGKQSVYNKNKIFQTFKVLWFGKYPLFSGHLILVGQRNDS